MGPPANQDSEKCCAPGNHRSATARNPESRGTTCIDDIDTSRMKQIGGEAFLMGTDDDVGFDNDGESPVREVFLDTFYIDQHAVTNAEFLQFVQDTDYTTEAEKQGWSFVFRNHLSEDADDDVLGSVAEAPWWLAVEGAMWAHPFGPGSGIADKLDHPVTHVSWNDAIAFANWSGKRLPTEAEWEYAARGGLEQQRYPWGDELHPDGIHRSNIWQGTFPDENTCADGYCATAPVDAFAPNEYGLYNMSGNVWEWCSDWWSTDYHVDGPRENPRGPPSGNAKVIRGGSHLCHRSYCNRYRVAARSQNSPDSTTSHTGFRLAVDG